MTRPTNTWLVFNTASGSNTEDAQREVIEMLRGAGSEAARVIDLQDSPDITPSALDREGVSRVAIFTGDGSLSSVVQSLDGWGGEILVLPGGTTNLFAKALHGEDVTLETVAAGLKSGGMHRVRRNAIAYSGGKAICELLAGPGATWSDVREDLREGALVAAAQNAIAAARESSDGSMVRLLEPNVGKAEGYAGLRLVPDADLLVADGYGTDGIGDFLRQGVALLQRDFRLGPHDKLGAFPQVECATVDGAEMALMVDGERCSGKPVERFSLAPLAVDLLALSA